MIDGAILKRTKERGKSFAAPENLYAIDQQMRHLFRHFAGCGRSND